MKTKLTIAFALSSLAAPAYAHRLDEYLQAIVVAVAHDRISATVRLIPGVAVSASVVSAVDSNRDGVFSASEQQAYAQKVLRDLTLSLDGRTLTPRLKSISFPTAADMKEGLGEIHLHFAANFSPGMFHRTLVVENHHQPRISVYLMNCLVPQDNTVQITAQKRSGNQSYYQVDYVQSDAPQDALLSVWRSNLIPALAPLPASPACSASACAT